MRPINGLAFFLHALHSNSHQFSAALLFATIKRVSTLTLDTRAPGMKFNANKLGTFYGHLSMLQWLCASTKFVVL